MDKHQKSSVWLMNLENKTSSNHHSYDDQRSTIAIEEGNESSLENGVAQARDASIRDGLSDAKQREGWHKPSNFSFKCRFKESSVRVYG
jgi:hypothetical protein